MCGEGGQQSIGPVVDFHQKTQGPYGLVSLLPGLVPPLYHEEILGTIGLSFQDCRQNYQPRNHPVQLTLVGLDVHFYIAVAQLRGSLCR